MATLAIARPSSPPRDSTHWLICPQMARMMGGALSGMTASRYVKMPVKQPMLDPPRQQPADPNLAGSYVTFRSPSPSHHWRLEEQNYETNSRYYSHRPGCSGAVRGASACRSGGRARFRASRHHGLRPDAPPTLGHYDR